MQKLLLNRKLNTYLRVAVLIIVTFAIIFAFLSYERDLGTYVFNKGSTPVSHLVGKTVKKATTYTFSTAYNEPVIKNLIFGSSSSLTVSIATLFVIIIAAIAQIVKLFNKRHTTKNFVNSLVIVIALIVTIAFSSALSVLIISIVALIVQVFLLIPAIFVEFKGMVYIENMTFVNKVVRG